MDHTGLHYFYEDLPGYDHRRSPDTAHPLPSVRLPYRDVEAQHRSKIEELHLIEIYLAAINMTVLLSFIFVFALEGGIGDDYPFG